MDAVGPEVRCVCFFGGDPTPQIGVLASFAERLRRERPDVRICFKTNGSASTVVFEQMLVMAAESGGTVKVDLKAQDEALHRALTGLTNKQTLANVAMGLEQSRDHPDSLLLVISTLLVPGYVDQVEVDGLARRIADLDARTPYALLAFQPAFAMTDLSPTRRNEADTAESAARAVGLIWVIVGNRHLLW